MDATTIEGLFRRLDEYLKPLRDLASKPRESLVDDPINLGAAKYYLQVAIECCIDVAHHLISRQGFRSPESYADSFAVLAQEGIISKAFLPTAQRMARLRNRLVHLYWEVDAGSLYKILQQNLGDFNRFKVAVLRFVASLQGNGEEG